MAHHRYRLLGVAFLVILLVGCAAPPPVPTASPAPATSAFPYPPAHPQAGDIFHVPTGLPLTVDGIISMLSGARVVYVGETHDNLEAHRVELRVIQELARRLPGRVAIAMEMFRQPQQPVLDRWVRGELSEAQFIKDSKWYSQWGMDFGYYRDILEFARAQHLDVVALRPDEQLEMRFRHADPAHLPPELVKRLPEMGTADPYQVEAMRAVYSGHMPSPHAFASFLRTQQFWEEAMAARIVDYLRSPGGSGKVVVVLAGSWHVRYGFGIPKKALRRLPVAYATVLPQELDGPPAESGEGMDIKLPAIPLLPCDFIWYIHYKTLETGRGHLGVMLADESNRVVVAGVEPGSPAAKAGVSKGDQIIAIDGQAVANRGDVTEVLMSRHAGDAVMLRVRNAQGERDVRVVLGSGE